MQLLISDLCTAEMIIFDNKQTCLSLFTDAASCAIVKFLEIDSTEETSNGWMLLSTINLLSTGSASLIDCMTAASLPSTLVKCLYLFFDLPGVLNEDRVDPECEFTPRERRILLQKVFVQVSGGKDVCVCLLTSTSLKIVMRFRQN